MGMELKKLRLLVTITEIKLNQIKEIEVKQMRK
jgi:hypothetical protein